MTSEDTILNEIKHMRTDYNKIDKRIEGLETAVKLVAVQSNRIERLENLTAQHETELKIVSNFQASCPRDGIKEAMKKQNWVIGLVLTITTATFLKALGVY